LILIQLTRLSTENWLRKQLLLFCIHSFKVNQVHLTRPCGQKLQTLQQFLKTTCRLSPINFNYAWPKSLRSPGWSRAVLPALIKKPTLPAPKPTTAFAEGCLAACQELFHPFNDRLWITRHLSTRSSLSRLPASGRPTPTWLSASTRCAQAIGTQFWSKFPVSDTDLSVNPEKPA
jgi:hypothetical protein